MKRRPLALVGVVVLAAFCLVALLAPWLAPYDPTAIDGAALEAPSGAHLLGTDDVGHDILSQLIWGTRSSMAVALPAAAAAVLIGIVVGVGGSLLGGLADVVVGRLLDAFLSLPVLPLLVLVTALVGPSPFVVALAIALMGWPESAWILRSRTLSLRGRGFVSAARGFGAGPPYLLRRHLLPALGPLVVVAFVNWAGLAILLQAGLAVLGIGDPTQVSWGLVLNRALDHPGIYNGLAWLWWVLPAGLAITLVALAFTLIGVSLEPSFNPRWRRAG